jgi:hypothetical protein
LKAGKLNFNFTKNPTFTIECAKGHKSLKKATKATSMLKFILKWFDSKGFGIDSPQAMKKLD